MREGQSAPEVAETPEGWYFQIVAESFTEALAMLLNVIQLALLNDHWKPNASAETLTNQADGLSSEMSIKGDAGPMPDRRERSMLLELYPDLMCTR